MDPSTISLGIIAAPVIALAVDTFCIRPRRLRRTAEEAAEHRDTQRNQPTLELRAAESCMRIGVSYITNDGIAITGDTLHQWILEKAHKDGTEHDTPHCPNPVCKKLSETLPEKPSGENPEKVVDQIFQDLSGKNPGNVSPENRGERNVENRPSMSTDNPDDFPWQTRPGKSSSDFMGNSPTKIVWGFMTELPRDLIDKNLGHQDPATFKQIRDDVLAKMSAGDFPSLWAHLSADEVFVNLLLRDHRDVADLHMMGKPCPVAAGTGEPRKPEQVHLPHRWGHGFAQPPATGSTAYKCPGGYTPVTPITPITVTADDRGFLIPNKIKPCDREDDHGAHVRGGATCPGRMVSKPYVSGGVADPWPPAPLHRINCGRARALERHAPHQWNNRRSTRDLAKGTYQCAGYYPPMRCGSLDTHGPHIPHRYDGELYRCDGRINESSPCPKVSQSMPHIPHSWSDRSGNWVEFDCPGLMTRVVTEKPEPVLVGKPQEKSAAVQQWELYLKEHEKNPMSPAAATAFNRYTALVKLEKLEKGTSGE